MLELDLRSPIPIYDQIKAGLRGLVARGLLRPGDAAPSIRSMAAQLKVNPNTVARAFRELTLEGFLEARRGDGSLIAEGAARHVKDGMSELREGLKDALLRARRGGLSWGDVDALVRASRKEEP